MTQQRRTTSWWVGYLGVALLVGTVLVDRVADLDHYAMGVALWAAAAMIAVGFAGTSR